MPNSPPRAELKQPVKAWYERHFAMHWDEQHPNVQQLYIKMYTAARNDGLEAAAGHLKEAAKGAWNGGLIRESDALTAELEEIRALKVEL